MKESYSESLASHTGPESCGVTRKGDPEALIGEVRARILNREKPVTPGRRLPCLGAEGNISYTAIVRGARVPRGRRPWHAWTQLIREPGYPAFFRNVVSRDASGSPRTQHR